MIQLRGRIGWGGGAGASRGVKGTGTVMVNPAYELLSSDTLG